MMSFVYTFQAIIYKLIQVCVRINHPVLVDAYSPIPQPLYLLALGETISCQKPTETPACPLETYSFIVHVWEWPGLGLPLLSLGRCFSVVTMSAFSCAKIRGQSWMQANCGKSNTQSLLSIMCECTNSDLLDIPIGPKSDIQGCFWKRMLRVQNPECQAWTMCNLQVKYMEPLELRHQAPCSGSEVCFKSYGLGRNTFKNFLSGSPLFDNESVLRYTHSVTNPYTE